MPHHLVGICMSGGRTLPCPVAIWSTEMTDHNEVTTVEEIADFRHVRPHLVIIGAGASRAAFPRGERRGHPLPLMADLTEIVPVSSVLDEYQIDWRGNNFEEVYSASSGDSTLRGLRKGLEKMVFNYFSELELPDSPTLYDSLVLSLRKKDVIATFNWDPFLIQALARSARVTTSLPTPLFLHGNVSHGYCDRDSYQGWRGDLCPRCGKPFKPTRLLFPIATKDYSSDPAIRKAWEVMREALRNALVVTVFGYSAPASDRDAHSIMSEAWGEPARRPFELFEMVDVRQQDELRASWQAFIFSGHYRACRTFPESFLAIHPRRSIEAFLNQYIDAKFLAGNRVIEAATLDELHEWFRPLVGAEENEAVTADQ